MFASAWIGCSLAAAQQTPVQNRTATPDVADSEVAVEPAQEQDEIEYWTTSWALQDIDLRTVTKRLKSLGFEMPIDAKGTASVNFHIGVPIKQFANTRLYRFRGSLIASDVQLDQLTIPELFVDLSYENGKWKLERIDGKTQSGTFAGTATATMNPPGPFKAELTVQQLKLQPLIEVIGKLSGQPIPHDVTGVVDGKLEIAGKVDQIQQFSKWTATGKLNISNLSVGKSAKYVVNLDQFSLRDQRFQIEKLRMSSADHPDFFLQASGYVSLDANQRFDLMFAGNDVPTGDLLGFYFQSPESLARGKVDVKGTVRGSLGSAAPDGPAVDPATIAPPSIEADFLVASPDLQLFGLDMGLIEHRLQLSSGRIELRPLFEPSNDPRCKIERIQATYAISPQAFTLENFVAQVLGGSIRGKGTFARVPSGTHRFNLRWDGIEPSSQLFLPWMPRSLAVAAKSSGSMQWSAPADKIDFPAFHRGDAEIEIESLTLGGESLGSLAVKLKLDQQEFKLDAAGELLGGSIGLASEAKIAPEARWVDLPQVPLAGKLSFRELAVSDAVRVFSPTRDRRFSGRLSGAVDFRVPPDAPLRWESKLALRNLTVDQRKISQQINAEVSHADGVIELHSVEGDLAGGRLAASGRWSLAGGNRILDVRLTRARGAGLFMPVRGSGNSWMDGIVSGRATISGTGSGPLDGVRAVGSLRVIDAQVYGVAIGDAHSPFRIQVNTAPLHWRATFPRIQARFSRGNLVGSLKASSALVGAGVNLESRWKVNHVDFEEMLSSFIGTNTIGRGDVTGDLSLSGQRIRDVADLRGQFRFRLGSTDATAVPGLSAAGSILGPLSLSGIRFTSGEAKGQISQGAVRIEQLAMTSDRMRVQANGRVFLSGPRMDFRALVETGNFQGQDLLTSQLATVAAGSLVPWTTASSLLLDRSFVLDLHGSLANPQVRLLADETIQTNLRRRLFRDAIGLAIGDAILLGD